MTDYTGSYFSLNDSFIPVELLKPGAFESGLILYEVLRIQEGKALFIEDHLNRLQQSILLSGYTYPLKVNELKHRLAELALKNRIAVGNVKIIAIFHSAIPDIYAFFIPHFYPTAEMYRVGVKAELFRAERPDPNIKKLHPEMIRKISAFIKDNNIYDALLVDESGCITEGSRTNIFFIRGNRVLTTPGDKVLKGITREKVIWLCHKMEIPLIEEPIRQSEIQLSGAAFFSGTSPKILPVSRIGQLNFNVADPLLKRLINAYDDLIREYLVAG